MAKILIIGGGAMGAAFTIPCLENNNNVIITAKSIAHTVSVASH